MEDRKPGKDLLEFLLDDRSGRNSVELIKPERKTGGGEVARGFTALLGGGVVFFKAIRVGIFTASNNKRINSATVLKGWQRVS
jgi:hypothetical protein